MKEKRQCAKQVVTYQGLARYSGKCQINATVEEDGKWWCKTHCPSLVTAKDVALREKWRTQDAERIAGYRRAENLARLRQAVIDAAKARVTFDYGDPGEMEADAALVDAVNALLAAES